MTLTSDARTAAAHGRIQSFGAMLVADAEFRNIEYASNNIGNFIDFSVDECVGRSVKSLLGREFGHTVANFLSRETIETQREYIPDAISGRPDIQFSVIRSGPNAILECLPKIEQTSTSFTPLQSALSFLNLQSSPRDIEDLLQECTEQLRAQLRLDRVMFLRMNSDRSGDVIAEARHPGVASYLGHRLPPGGWAPMSDNTGRSATLRLVADANDTGVGLVPTDADANVDLTTTFLQGINADEVAELASFGAQSALSLSTCVGGAVWGTFLCHGTQPFQPDPEVLASMELIGRMLGVILQQRLEVTRQDQMARIPDLIDALVAPAGQGGTAERNWDRINDDLKSLIPSDGVAFCDGDIILTHGDTPPASVIGKAKASVRTDDQGVFSGEHLKMRMPGLGWGSTGGMLLVEADASRETSLIYFRNTVETNVASDVPQPRRIALATYLTTLQKRSDGWSTGELDIALSLAKSLSRAVAARSDIRGFRPANGMTPRELNHRVRNLLALVQSLAHKFHSTATSAQDAADALEGRVQALASAHNLLTRNDARAVRLVDILMSEPGIKASPPEKISVSGPPITLAYESVPVMSLAIHELTSNALRHGGLSRAEGGVDISWSVTGDDLTLLWQENQPLDPSDQRQARFGHTVLREAISYELGGKSQLTFGRDGFRAELTLPSRVFTLDQGKTAARIPGTQPTSDPSQQSSPMQAQRILVVEDSYVVAKFAQQIMWEEGAAVVDIVPSNDEAHAILEKNSYDFCLLDVNLRGVMSTEIASVLKKKNIPFAFSTGYGSDAGNIAQDFNVPQLSKPIDLNLLRTVVRQELERD